MESKIINFTEEEKKSYKSLLFKYQNARRMARNGNNKMHDVALSIQKEMQNLEKQIAKNHGVDEIGLVNHAGLIM